MKWMGIAGALSFAFVNASYADEVVIPGSFAVSESGAATYSIDIDVPPGTAGIEPKLSLTYSSQGGNGLLGMGWSLSGLSSITRCPKTVAQDGVRGAVRFNADDRFCLDGQRLIATSGTYGASGTEYRTEMEGFSRITSNGTTGTGPTSFTVETKSGLTMAYGNTSDSRVDAQGKAEASAWAVNRIDDTLGNYMNVTYVDDGTNGEHRPIKIVYSGHLTSGASASVEFTYETRPDINPVYHAGSLFKTTQRLTHVKTFVGTSLVTDYRLTYDTSPATYRSRLTSLERCDGMGACLPQSVFSWSNSGPLSYSYIANPGGHDGNYSGWTPRLVDFNADGKTDILLSDADIYGRSNGNRDIWLSQGNGQNYTYITNPEGHDGNYVTYVPRFADMNGDGRPEFFWSGSDIYGRSNTNRDIWSSTGTGMGYTYIGNPAGQDGNYSSWKPYLADFNGDGRADVLWQNEDTQGRGLGNRDIWLSLDDGTNYTIVTNPGGHDGNFSNWTLRLADFDGDGFADLFMSDADIYGRSNGNRDILFNQGDGHAFGHVANPNGHDGTYQGRTPHFGDFNGDGKTDILWNGEDIYGRSNGQRAIWLSKGNWTHFETVANPGGHNGNFVGWMPRLADFNGDGKTDILWSDADIHGRSQGNRDIWISLGDGATFTHIVNPEGHDGNYVNWRPHFGDFNGDGRADFFWSNEDIHGISNGHRDIWLSTGSPDLLTSINDGFGDKIRLTYKPLTDISVYVKGSGSVYPEVDLQLPSYVVSRAEVRDGIGGFVPTEYRYGGLRARADGRGSVGFAWTEAEQVETDFVTRREYRQDYPYLVRIWRETTSAPNVGLAGVLSEKTYSFACLNPANGLGCVEAAGNRYFPYASSVVEKGWDLDGSVLPTVTTTNTYDSWGNATQIDVVTSDGFSKSTTNTYTNDAVNWILGRLTRTEVTDVSP